MRKPYVPSNPKAKKYVAGNKKVITFPRSKVHAQEAKARLPEQPKSAGFFDKKHGVRAYGYSDSLQLKSKPGDSKKIKKHLSRRHE